MRDAILSIPNFVSPEDSQEVIAAFYRCRPEYAHKIGDGFFDHRVMWASSYPPSEAATRFILRRWAEDATHAVSLFFNEPVIYCDGIQTVVWEGLAMPPHQDDRHPDPNEPHGTPWRFIASVIYLNDNYTGGEIYFPHLLESIKPQQGQLIAFPGAWWHGVRAVTNGARFTAPSWYSRDPKNEDQFFKTVD